MPLPRVVGPTRAVLGEPRAPPPSVAKETVMGEAGKARPGP